MPSKSSDNGALPHWKTYAKWFAASIAVLAAGGFLFAWSGLYSVAATKGHWPVFGLILEFGMRSSVRTHAFGIEVPDLSDAVLAERGAGHFQTGCAPCHGGPGQPPNPIVQTTLPEPPDLSAKVPKWKPNELFWIVKNGLKYTGMPAWVSQDRDDEVWAIVAFLQRLPRLSADQYRALASLDRGEEEIPIRTSARGGPVGMGLTACSRCHGLDGAGRSSGAFPRLDIQTADYLFAQMQAYAADTRQSGFMQPVAVELEQAEMRRLADYYAAQRPVVAESSIPDGSQSLAAGRLIATAGVPAEGIPACTSCHGDDPTLRNPLYPSLDGQHASYISQQLVLFKAGKRRSTPAAEIMTVIAQRLTEEQIASVSTYFAGLPLHGGQQ